MKIGKYPVKHSYKIPRIIADVFSVGLAVFICSVEIMFMTVYDDTLKTYIRWVSPTAPPARSWKS